jgi:hypothetical protein
MIPGFDDNDPPPIELTEGIYEGIPMARYLGDPAPSPSLSSSIAHLLAVKSPRHAFNAHPRLGNGFRPTTDEMANGTLLHDLLLEDGQSGRIVVVEADSFRTKAAQSARDMAYATGRVPIARPKFNGALDVAEHMKASIHECGFWDLLAGARKEVTVLWRSEGGVLCRCRPDGLYMGDDETIIFDLKTCASAAPDDCAKSFTNYGYDIASVAYTEAIETLHPHLAGRVTMLFLFCEVEAPYVCTPVVASGEMNELGARKWKRARERWANGLAHDDWPMYATSPVAVVPPVWEMQKEGM